MGVQAKKDSRIKIHYQGKTLDDAYVMSTKDKDPMELTIGAGVLPDGLEENIIGMSVGEKKEITLPPEEGFGMRSSELVTKVNKDEFPDQADPKIGNYYKLKLPDGRIKEAMVKAVDESTVTLDANHPLAGRTVKLEVELVDVR
jgi:FKBP-type peptidyl-prolyl cis-trans isomerase 2